jgi:hypothetical protein
LFAAPFDAKNLEVTGASVPLIEHIAGFSGAAPARSTGVSTNGTPDLPARPVARQFPRRSSGSMRGGTRQPLRTHFSAYSRLDFAPDDAVSPCRFPTRVDRGLWVYDLERGVMTRLLPDATADEVEPIWTPDGRRIVFSSTVMPPEAALVLEAGGRIRRYGPPHQ